MPDIFNSLKSEVAKLLTTLGTINSQIQQRAISVRQSASRLDFDSAEQLRAMTRFVETSRRSGITKLAQYHETLIRNAERLIELSERAKSIARPLGVDCEISDLSHVPKILSDIQQLRAEIADATKPIPPPQPQYDILPPFANATYVVHDMRQSIEVGRNQTPPLCIYTPTQEIYGSLWRLKIYPFGNMNGRSTHVSVFVEMNRGPGVKTPYTYKIEIVSSNPIEKSIIREFRSEFTVNDSWGWNKAILIEKVMEFLNEEGDLMIVLALKPETYYQAYRDLKVAFAEEKTKYKALKEQERTGT
jgi:hypothetical protein